MGSAPLAGVKVRNLPVLNHACDGGRPATGLGAPDRHAANRVLAFTADAAQDSDPVMTPSCIKDSDPFMDPFMGL
jgi:hypothetical protein